MIQTTDFNPVIADPVSYSLEARISGAVHEQNPIALARTKARFLVDSAYHSFETQYTSQEFVSNYTSLKQEKVASLKQQLKELRDTATDDASKKVFDNYYRAAQLQFAQKEKSLERTVAVNYAQPASYQSDEYLCSTVVTDPSFGNVAGAIGALGIGFAMAGKRKRKKNKRKEVSDNNRTPLPAVDDEVIAGDEDEDSDDASAVSGGVNLSLARTVPLDEIRSTAIHENILPEPSIIHVDVDANQAPSLTQPYTGRISEVYLSASKPISDFAAESPTNPGVLGTNERRTSQVTAAIPRKPSFFSKAALAVGGIVIGAASAVAISVGAATYVVQHSSPETAAQAVYSSPQSAAPQTTYANPIPVSQPAAPVVERPPNFRGIYYFPEHAPKNETGGKKLSADWYQIEHAAQTVDSFILQIGNDVSLDGRVARFGIDTDGNGKADKIIYKSLDHHLKLPLSNGETVVHAGFGVKSDAGFTYLASVSKMSGDIQYSVVSKN
ncbi:hypothetical protein HZA99_00290 [Candidatus Woesearchaeota archaeon]|nr:hypothetical protein [Candidatus Woesearchaeota archaeon]